MTDKGLFGGGLFDESLFDAAGVGVCGRAVGESVLIGIGGAIHAGAGVATGESELIGMATAIHAASGIAVGESALIGVGSRVRFFPPHTGFRVQRWGGVR